MKESNAWSNSQRHKKLFELICEVGAVKKGLKYEQEGGREDTTFFIYFGNQRPKIHR